MSIKNQSKRALSLILTLALVFSVFAGLIPTSLTQTASAVSTVDYTTAGAASYTATARVDESVGLRASVSVTGNTSTNRAVGITPMDTSLIRSNVTATVSGDDTLSISVTPYDNYTTDQIVVAAIAEITHTDGTMEAVKDVQTISVNSTSVYNTTYSVSDFTGYVQTGDIVNVEIIIYGDFSYSAVTSESAADFVINLSNGTVTGQNGNTANTTSGVYLSGRVFYINTANAHGKTIWIKGQTLATGTTSTTGIYQVYVYNANYASTTGTDRDIHLVLDGVTSLVDPNMSLSSSSTYYYRDYVGGTVGGSSFAARATPAGTLRRGSSTQTTTAPLVLSDVDAYVTLYGDSILAQSSSYYDSGSIFQGAIGVYASSSLIVTDASTGTLYAKGGGCSAAIGSSGSWPSGYVEIDGGSVTAESAISTHAFAGIGNGGHYSNTDPGTRGIVINGGTVNALGFHYGIGANGGTSGTINTAIGKQYIVITEGNVTTEASGGSMGAALGFAYNNASHEVRIGRIDKSDSATTVMSVNWGYGAAISGKMTFYSGSTEAYSGQYAAAIGGNAISNATVYVGVNSTAQAAGSAVAGTPLTVYGGTVTAESGAFEQDGYGTYSPTGATTQNGSSVRQRIRGMSATRLSASAVYNEARPSTSYGAAIGGAINRAGGTENKIFAGTFNVTSSVYGAGIGGGGGYGTLTAGGGGNTWIGKLTDLSSSIVQPMSFTVNEINTTTATDYFGAGIGGGGSYSSAAGSGGNVYIGGGNFTVFGSKYGAAFGGGGSYSAAAGSGGNVVINGGEFGLYGGLYGAGFGGGGTYSGTAGSGGNNVTINDGAFTVYSGLYGAGIGGGGTSSGTGGSGGSSFTINGGNFKVFTGVESYTVSGTTVTPNFYTGTASYGAGIGGGGSYSGTAGSGSSSFLVNGGRFNATSNGYGAGIGGGGTRTGTAGTGGTATYYGGTVEVQADTQFNTKSVGMGGGSADTASGGTEKTQVGDVTVLGGNIYTEITSLANGGGAHGDQHAYTRPDPYGTGALGYVTTTSTAIKIEVPASEIGNLVHDVAYWYNLAWNFDYGTNDTWVTEAFDDNGNQIGVVWVWVPSEYELSYDLTTGRISSSYTSTLSNSSLNDFDIGDATREAVGITYLRMINTLHLYNYNGDKKDLIDWNEYIESDEMYENAYWKDVNLSAQYHQSPGNLLYNLAEHDDVGGVPVYLIGWTNTVGGIIDTSTGNEHIFGLSDGWDYTLYAIDNVAITNTNVTVYALWGYDANGNGVPDVREAGLTLSYNANGGSGAPINSTYTYTYGQTAGISNTVPTRSGYVFLGWSKDTAYMPFDLNDTLSSLPSDIYVNNGTITYGDGTTINASSTPKGNGTVTFASTAITLYALWAEDTNGNNIPDFLETTYYLIHEGNGAVSGVPANKAYIDGLTGTSDSGTSMVHSTASNIFLGWTENASATFLLTRTHTAADEPSDLDDPITLSAVFNGGDKRVYAVWATDTNSNGIPDYLENGLSFIYDTQTTDPVNGVPSDPTAYYDLDTVSTTINDPELSASTSALDPYMQRTGWVLLGWVDTVPAQNDWTSDPALSAVTYTFLNTVSGLSAFSLTDISIYAVWGRDSNNNGIADWDDDDGRTVKYIPNLSSTYLDVSTMPFYTGSATSFVDYGPSTGSTFANYTSDETAALSTQVPQATGYVFLGWSPVYIGGTIFGESTNLGLSDFYDLLVLIDDIPQSTNYSGRNDINYMTSGSSTALRFGEAKYTVQTGFESIFTSIAGGTSISTAFAGYDWINNYSGQGLLTSVTFDAFNFTKDQIGGDADSETWNMYGIWGEDVNGNGIADIFETAYSLRYVKDVSSPSYLPATGGPANQYNKYYPGQTAGFSSIKPAKLDNNYNPMIFLGWTTDPNVLECYGTGQASLIPPLAGGVTFGNFDITVYAVWALDLDQDGIPDPYQGGFTLTYDANGGSSAPVDSTTYQYGQSTAVDTTTVPTHPSSYIFLYWTDDDTLASVYGASDRAILPAEVHNVTFTNSNITLYAVWGEDLDNNGIPDVYENPYRLYYDANGGTGEPTDSILYAWNDNVILDSGAGMTNSSYVFVGWTEALPTTFNSVYTVGEAALLPTLVTDVTFTSVDITVYAVWSTDINGNGIPDVNEAYGNLYFDLNGGSDGTGTNAFATQQLLGGQTIILPIEEPTPPLGETFTGWFDGTTTYLPGGSFTMPAQGDVTLTAQYSGGFAATIDVTYDANDSSGATFVDSQAAGTYTVLACSFTAPSGMQFKEWNMAADGSGTSYDPGDTFTLSADVTLYAIWEDIQTGITYSVTYNDNGADSGAVPVDSGSYSSGGSVTVLGNTGVMVKAGYTFEGWTTDSAGTGTVYAENDIYTIYDDVTFYAVWRVEAPGQDYYYLTVQASTGGSVNNSVSGWYQEDDVITVIATANSNYEFVEWTTAAGGSFANANNATTIFTMPENDVTVTAKFKYVGDGDVMYTVKYVANGGTGSYSIQVSAGDTHTVLTRSYTGISRSGYTFTGWNTSANGRGTPYSPGDRIVVEDDITLYAQWERNDDGTDSSDNSSGKISFGGIGTGTSTTYFTGVKSTGSIGTVLDTVNHYAYITGYPDGTVRPANNITRAEVATIFFRLLTDDYREQYWSKKNSFTDVNESQWYNNAISTLSNAKLLSGYSDGSFKPGNSITRAEFASMAVKIAKAAGITSGSGAASFNDISGHWAEADIKLAAELGYIKGDGSGTFRPNDYITRAEVMTLINRMLKRQVESEEDLLDNMTTWADNTPDKWYYFDVQEATNSHYSIRKYDDVNEIWSTLRVDPDWTALQGADAVWKAMTK